MCDAILEPNWKAVLVEQNFYLDNIVCMFKCNHEFSFAGLRQHALIHAYTHTHTHNLGGIYVVSLSVFLFANKSLRYFSLKRKIMALSMLIYGDGL